MNTISISRIIAAHRCPVRFALEQNTPRGESARYTLAKQIAYHLGGELDTDAIWQEVCSVAPGIDAGCKAVLGDWIARCAPVAWRRAADLDVTVSSSRFGIHGVIDRQFDDEPYFSLVRSSEAPAAGIYNADRIRVACYAFCFEEMMGTPSNGVVVEYIPSGIARLCVPQPRDRRAAIRAIRTAQAIAAGNIPRKPRRAPCESCPQFDLCSAGATKLSDLL